jgi:hypothetical protein
MNDLGQASLHPANDLTEFRSAAPLGPGLFGVGNEPAGMKKRSGGASGKR